MTGTGQIADQLNGETDELTRDAERWRALMRCPRIRMHGSAGVDWKTGERRGDYAAVHFGADFWSDGAQPGCPQSGEEMTQWGKHCLTALVDDIIEKGN